MTGLENLLKMSHSQGSGKRRWRNLSETEGLLFAFFLKDRSSVAGGRPVV